MTRTAPQQNAAIALTRAGYAIEFQDRGHGQITLLASAPEDLPEARHLDPATHFVRLRWQDRRFYDAEVNYDMGGGGAYRSIRAALDEVIW